MCTQYLSRSPWTIWSFRYFSANKTMPTPGRIRAASLSPHSGYFLKATISSPCTQLSRDLDKRFIHHVENVRRGRRLIILLLAFLAVLAFGPAGLLVAIPH